MQKSPPIDISFFGTTSCDNLPFGIGDEEFGCPSNDPNWVKLAEVTVFGEEGNQWVEAFLEATPEEDIYAIAIGPDCSPINSQVSTYYFFDNLILADFESFNLKITETSHPCNPNFSLRINFNPAYEYQWYLNGIALDGETSSELSQHYGEGSYQVRIIDNGSCRLSENFEFQIPIFNETVQEIICEGDSYPFGDLNLTESGFYLDTFLSVNLCDSIVPLELEVIGQQFDTVEASILTGEEFVLADNVFDEAGDYPLVFSSSIGCDSLVLLKLTEFNIFIPNIFSPDQDGMNDVFEVYAGDNNINESNIQIFDRWGNKIHEGVDWDGRNVQSGVYVYLIELHFTNGTSKVFSGDITLIR